MVRTIFAAAPALFLAASTALAVSGDARTIVDFSETFGDVQVAGSDRLAADAIDVTTLPHFSETFGKVVLVDHRGLVGPLSAVAER